MKFTLFALLAAMATARPLEKRQAMNTTAPTDTQVLQYALTLEHLENAFYSGALNKLSASDFQSAGFPDWVRQRLMQVSEHESDHVSLLSGALGNATVQPCNYSFPYTDAQSFLSLAATIENVGVSAYAGAAQYITDPAYLTIAATILSTEARHQAWENSAALKQEPWSSAYDTALSLDMVYTIASAFITSCPSSNPALPVMAYPALTVSSGAAAGQSATFTYNATQSSGSGSGSSAYAIFYNGVGTASVALNNNQATIPAGLQGYSYVVVSSTNSTTSPAIVAGPAILYFPFNSEASNPPFMG